MSCPGANGANGRQGQRLLLRSAFFALFLLAPALDLFRLDLTQGHFVVLGHDWVLDVRGVTAEQAAWRLLTRAFLPLAIVIGGFAYVSWRWGRFYCGWLCPHYSVVETINALMRRATGKPSLWQNKRLPERQRDGTVVQQSRAWWPLVLLAVVFFALLWAITLLTYLLPPAVVWGNLLNASLTPNQLRFLAVATALLTVEFALARHLFCRYGCAVGLAQSLVWMGNGRARQVSFDRTRARSCAACDASCEHACPMRLRPRQIKRRMFTCTQCELCVQACERVSFSLGQAAPLALGRGEAGSALPRRVRPPAGSPAG
ncbi:MAG: 4Fe-4S binding protein [Pseudomonadota bacterium]